MGEVGGFGCTSKTQPITYRNLGLQLVRWLSGRTTPRVCLTPTGEGVIQPHFLRHPSAAISGAGKRNRTPDLMLTRQLLYRLSYTGNKLVRFVFNVRRRTKSPTPTLVHQTVLVIWCSLWNLTTNQRRTNVQSSAWSAVAEVREILVTPFTEEHKLIRRTHLPYVQPVVYG